MAVADGMLGMLRKEFETKTAGRPLPEKLSITDAHYRVGVLNIWEALLYTLLQEYKQKQGVVMRVIHDGERVMASCVYAAHGVCTTYVYSNIQYNVTRRERGKCSPERISTPLQRQLILRGDKRFS
jgi:hypothetical protein